MKTLVYLILIISWYQVINGNNIFVVPAFFGTLCLVIDILILISKK
jgi:hypothetical protein